MTVSDLFLYAAKASEPEIIAACTLALVDLAADQKEDKARIQALLAKQYKKIGKINEAILAILAALDLDPKCEGYWLQFADTLKIATFEKFSKRAADRIIECFSKPGIAYQQLAISSLSLLKHLPGYGTSSFFLEDPLLLFLLKECIVPDQSFEAWMTSLRKKLLLTSIELPEAFIAALKEQCCLNEYVYAVSREEIAALDKLLLEPFPTEKQKNLLACYLPLKEKEQHGREIPSLKKVTNAISQTVQRQYEENPYPRWKTLSKSSPASISEYLQSLFPLQQMPKGLSEHPEVLIAGCGTGQQALMAAVRYANSQVLAVDLSFESLAYAIKKKKELNIANVRFLQGDLLDLPMLNQTFDLIECSGVLHHMEDPIEGWKVLTQLLRPNGIMNVSLYSATARQDIVKAREIISLRKYLPTPENIRALRQELFGNTAFSTLTQSIDFYTTSACRDLLFHVQEHRFTLAQIDKILQSLHLDLIGIELPCAEVHDKYRSLFPSDPSATDLKNWAELEEAYPHTFLGMYHLWLQCFG